MFRKFFDTAIIDSLAAWIAKELPKTIPVDRCEYGSAFVTKKLIQFEGRLRSWLGSQKESLALNFYQKAKLGVRLQQELEAVGYPEAFCRSYSHNVVKIVAFTSSWKS